MLLFLTLTFQIGHVCHLQQSCHFHCLSLLWPSQGFFGRLSHTYLCNGTFVEDDSTSLWTFSPLAFCLCNLKIELVNTFHQVKNLSGKFQICELFNSITMSLPSLFQCINLICTMRSPYLSYNSTNLASCSHHFN